MTGEVFEVLKPQISEADDDDIGEEIGIN